MELRQLRYFAKAAETLNFSDAAKALNIAQSTLSQQVKRLEEELGVQLLQRDSHSMSLTEAGCELLPIAMRTLHDADTCAERIRDLRQLLTGTLNIGVTFSFSPILTETLTEFMKRHPYVKLNIYYKPMEELMEMLGRHEVDFVLAFRSVIRKEETESHVLFDSHLAAIVRDGHPLANMEKVSLPDLCKYDVTLPIKGMQARNAFDVHMSKFPAKLKVRLELNDVNILLRLIRRSNLVTVLAEATVYNVNGVKAIPLDLPDNEMEGCVHMLKNTYRKHSALEFIRMLNESNAVRERVREWFG